jgi:hypothetical protein
MYGTRADSGHITIWPLLRPNRGIHGAAKDYFDAQNLFELETLGGRAHLRKFLANTGRFFPPIPLSRLCGVGGRSSAREQHA